MNEKLHYIFICFCFICYSLHSQNNEKGINTIADNFQKVTKNSNSEIIYLQTSKDIFETEEDLWFKAYVLDAQYLIPSVKSKTLYLQLIEDKTQKAVYEERFEIENGFVDGHLFIQDSLKTGKYSLAAFSKHSFFQNQEEFNAIKKVTILKTINEKVEKATFKNDSIAQFSLFPEGGHLVSNLHNTFAFKAVDKKGLPVDVSGILYENDSPIINFESLHSGMGLVNFTPKKSKTYHIQLSNSHKKYLLPEIKTSGKMLNLVRKTKDFLVFKISQSKDLDSETVYLQLQVRGVLYSIASVKLKDEIILKIPLKEVPQGIAEVTLYNSEINPIAERLVFIKQDENLNIKTTLNKSEYENREKVTLKINVTDTKGIPIVAHLGVSVYDKIYEKKFEPKNILTHFYLSTQLKGKIFDPAYYFNIDNENRHEALNLLLLTQGWRRYVWNQNNLGKDKKTILSDPIIGNVHLEKIAKKSKTDGQKIVMVYSPDTSKSKDIITTDSIGDFSISSKHLKMGEKGFLYIKPMTPEKPKYVIDIKDSSFDFINEKLKKIPINYPLFKLNEEKIMDFREPLIVSDEVNKLEEVVISTNKKKVFRNKYLGTLDSLAKLEFNTDYVCNNGKGTLNCPQHDLDKSTKPIEGKVYYYMEGFKWNADRTAYTITGSGYKKYHYPKLTEEYLLKKFNLKMIKGYYGRREFYQPVYDEISINDPFPDYRNTLYWKSDIITDENGDAVIEFYCSDINTVFSGSIEGVSGTGILGSKNFKFKVNKKESQ